MTPFGDRALRFPLPDGVPRRRLIAELSRLSGVSDVVLAEDVGCVVFTDADVDRSEVTSILLQSNLPGKDDPFASHVIAVEYDGADLESVSSEVGRTKAEVIALHAEREYRVAMLGFLPGFAYLRGLASELHLPRRAPRTRVPAGSVAIAAQYTGIYPYASPGGWHLLGRASAFDPFAAGGGHATFAIGDIVRFSPCALGSSATVTPTTGERRARSPSGPPRAHLEVTRAAGFAILVDAGRPGRMHEGVPPGGPLVRSLFARANELAGNPSHACAIEVSGSIEVTARGGSVLVADDDAAVVLAEGERHVVSTAGSTRVRYLAVAGGIDAPVVLGGRGTLLVAGIGRLLRRGDCLQPDVSGGDLQAPAASVLVGPGGFAPAREPIAIMAGPDAAGISLDALAKRSFRVGAASDRTGTRLESVDPSALEQDVTQPKSEALTRRSTPMVVGAIEQTPSGLIVLGPDHPTTGGYPVVAVVVSSSLDDFFALPIGAHLRFVVRG